MCLSAICKNFHLSKKQIVIIPVLSAIGVKNNYMSESFTLSEGKPMFRYTKDPGFEAASSLATVVFSTCLGANNTTACIFSDRFCFSQRCHLYYLATDFIFCTRHAILLVDSCIYQSLLSQGASPEVTPFSQTLQFLKQLFTKVSPLFNSLPLFISAWLNYTISG